MKVIFFISTLLVVTYSLPQWKGPEFEKDGDGGRISGSYNFGKSSLGGTLGYNSGGGFGAGVKGTHDFGQGTSVGGSFYDSQHGAPETSVKLTHNFGQGTSLSTSHTFSGSDFDSSVGISHKTKNADFGAHVGHNSQTGTYAGIGASWKLGRKRRSIAQLRPEINEEEEEDNEMQYLLQ